MEDLPTEILQQIAWLSLNPELYLVSKKITSKLPNLRHFEWDVAAVLFCNRSPGCSWNDVNPFPWQTPQAATSNYALSINERRTLQELVLIQSWISEQKFRYLVTRFARQWFDSQWIAGDMPAETSKDIRDYLESRLFTGADITFREHQNDLCTFGYGSITIWSGLNYEKIRDVWVFEVLCYPLKFFSEPQSPSKLRFFRLFWEFVMRCRGIQDSPVPHPYSTLRKALSRVIIDGDLAWFKSLNRLASDDLKKDWEQWHQLVNEVSAAVLSGRKWKLMQEICMYNRLPNDYLESQLVPALTLAISDGDLDALEFQQWVEREGWAKIQRLTSLPY